jgi:5-(carboxyamino)imidazole ribonucleotide mutase
MSESQTSGAPVAIIMGSQSDWETMKNAAAVLDKLGVAHDCRIVSAHRTPDRLVEFAKTAHEQGFKVVIAGAGARPTCPAWSPR